MGLLVFFSLKTSYCRKKVTISGEKAVIRLEYESIIAEKVTNVEKNVTINAEEVIIYPAFETIAG